MPSVRASVTPSFKTPVSDGNQGLVLPAYVTPRVIAYTGRGHGQDDEGRSTPVL